ncbi:hypothetical protein N7486_007404 [Penicillium sp. IBT 16267x]|nr:hypothetical protein N7486_007404 [Penicillium sp. IBT 16267x]
MQPASAFPTVTRASDQSLGPTAPGRLILAINNSHSTGRIGDGISISEANESAGSESQLHWSSWGTAEEVAGEFLILLAWFASRLAPQTKGV